LYSDLLVQDHADQEGQRILGQKLVAPGVLGEMQFGHPPEARHLFAPYPARVQCPSLGNRLGDG